MNKERIEIYEKFLTGSCVFIIAGMLIWILYEDIFLFNCFDELTYKEDDLSFHYSLRNYQENWNGFFDVRNDFGYGWIFWTWHAVICYPFYLLFLKTGIQQPLCVAPRILQLVMAAGTVAFVYRMLKLYCKKKTTCLAGTAFYVLMPMMTFSADKFGTNGFVNFFIIASVYSLVRSRVLSGRELTKAAALYAVALGVKITALMALPLVLGLAWNHLGGGKTEKVKQIVLVVFVWGIVAIFLISPYLLGGAVWNETGFQETLDGLSAGIATRNILHVEGYFLQNLTQTFGRNLTGNSLMLLFLFGLFWLAVKVRGQEGRDYAIYGVSFLIAFLATAVLIQTGAWFCSMYMLQMMFVPMIAWAVPEHFTRCERVVILALLFFQIRFAFMPETYILKQARTNEMYKEKIAAGKEMYQIVTDHFADRQMIVWSDWTLPCFVNSLIRPENDIQLYSIWENFQTMGGTAADFIAIDTERLKESEIEKRIKVLRSNYPKEADMYESKVRTDCLIKQRFMDSSEISAEIYENLPGETILQQGDGGISKSRYELILEKSFLKFYRKVSP